MTKLDRRQRLFLEKLSKYKVMEILTTAYLNNFDAHSQIISKQLFKKIINMLFFLYINNFFDFMQFQDYLIFHQIR